MQKTHSHVINSSIDKQNKYAFNLISTDIDHAIRVLDENLVAARKANYRYGIAKALSNLAWSRITKFELPEAFEVLNEALEIFNELGNLFEVGTCWNYQAWIYFYLDDHQNRLECNLNYVKALNPVKDRDLYIPAISNLGDNYVKLGKIQQALETFQICLEMENLDIEQLGPLYNNLGEAYYFKKDYDIAEKWFLEAIELLEKSDNSRFLSYTRTNLAELYQKTGRSEKVIELLEQAKASALAHNQKRLLALVRKIYSNYYEELGETEKALDYYKEFVNLTEEYKSEAHSARLKTVMFNRQLVHIQKEKEIINQKNEELQKANNIIQLQSESLQKVNGQLRNFAYHASHDLKEPLRTMSNFSKLLKNNASERLNSDELEFLDFITSSAQRMDKMVNDLLAYATIDQIVNKEEELNLNELIATIKSDLSLKISESNAIVEHDTLPTIYSNQTLVKQLFQNLISNAIKFRKEDLNPVVSIKYYVSDDFHQFAIKDNGIGIKEGDKEKIFDIFSRLNNSTEYAGSGIGLATCSKIVEELNGKISVKSTYGKGSEFNVLLQK